MKIKLKKVTWIKAEGLQVGAHPGTIFCRLNCKFYRKKLSIHGTAMSSRLATRLNACFSTARSFACITYIFWIFSINGFAAHHSNWLSANKINSSAKL